MKATKRERRLHRLRHKKRMSKKRAKRRGINNGQRPLGRVKKIKHFNKYNRRDVNGKVKLIKDLMKIFGINISQVK